MTFTTGGWSSNSSVSINLGLLLILTCTVQAGVIKYSQRTVKTAYGELKGIVYPKGGNLVKEVEAFLGVPYASAPAASLRFMPPLTPSRWTGVKVAETYGPACPQILPDLQNKTEALGKMPLLKFTRVLQLVSSLTNQSEDCLYLNIFMPVLKDSSRGRGGEGGLAIAVLLQGESWEWGSGKLVDGAALAAYGHLMVITLNYRLNVLGFLQTTAQQGNYALMDVVAALHWIRENAPAFGADVGKITLMGHRTGAVVANFLMLAPVASELFHRVVLLSGSALSPWSFQRGAKSNVRKLAEAVRCLRDKEGTMNKGPLGLLNRNPLPILSSFSGGSGKSGLPPPPPVLTSPHDPLPPDVGPCLRLIQEEDLLSSVQKSITSPRFLSRFGPLVEGSVVKGDFVSEMRADPSGRFSRFPLLLGLASVESFGELNSEEIEDGLSEGKRDRILRTFVRNVFVYHLNEIYSTIRNEYTDWEKPRKDFIDVRDSILQVLSDGLTVAPAIQTASIHSGKGNGKTFLFHFQYEPDKSLYPNRIGSITEDLLEFAVGLGGSASPPDAKVSRGLMHYLCNFIISGDPNSGYDGSSVEDAQLPFWDSYDPINQFYLEIGSGEPRMKSHYRGHKMALWLNLIPQLHQSGGPEVAMFHHNFRDERPEAYEGIVREQAKQQGSDDYLAYPPAGQNTVKGQVSGPLFGVSSEQSSKGGPPSSIHGDEEEEEGEEEYGEKSRLQYPTLSPAVMSTSECPPNVTNATGMMVDGSSSAGDRDLVRQLAAAHYHSYGTALGVTIGVGCCLLLLNLLIFLAIYHQKSHNLPPSQKNGRASPDEENGPPPLPSSLSRPRSHPDLRGHGHTLPRPCHRIPSGHSNASVPALYNDDEVITDDDDIVQELRDISGHGHSSHSSFRVERKDGGQSSSSGFSSPSIPDPPPPPRAMSSGGGGGGAVTFASLSRGSVRVLKRDESRDFGESGTC